MSFLLVINGPNLNLLGEREKDIYGSATLEDICSRLDELASELGLSLKHFQSNSEGELIDFIHQNYKRASGIIINPGAYTHSSIAIRDAITATELPAIEVHLSNIQNRERFRKHSMIAPVCVGQVCGLGQFSYLAALRFLAEHIKGN